jgi:cation:H+ antiporter
VRGGDLGRWDLPIELHRQFWPTGCTSVRRWGASSCWRSATNLPEIAITYSAAASGQLDVAVSNILGGIAIQTVVLVALDAFGVRERRPLTYQAASLTLVIEGAVVLAVLVVVVMGTQLPRTLIHFRLTPDVVLIALIWVAGLVLTQRAGRSLPWSNSGEAPDSQPQPRGHSQTARAKDAKRRGVSTGKAALVFGAAAAATLIAGALAEKAEPPPLITSAFPV